MPAFFMPMCGCRAHTSWLMEGDAEAHARQPPRRRGWRGRADKIYNSRTKLSSKDCVIFSNKKSQGPRYWSIVLDEVLFDADSVIFFTTR